MAFPIRKEDPTLPEEPGTADRRKEGFRTCPERGDHGIPGKMNEVRKQTE
jgi:hypothetical protein